MTFKELRNNLFAEIEFAPEVLKQSYLPSLDGFRAIAIGLTIYTHFSGTHFGPVGVYVFFVISGFLITTLLLKERMNKGTIKLKNFYIRRFLRIIPVYWLFIITVLLINILTQHSIGALPYLSAVFFFANIIMPADVTWQFGHYWSLSIEEQYYLIFPSILKRLSIKKYMIFLLGSLLAIFIFRCLEYKLFRLNKSTLPTNPFHYIYFMKFFGSYDGIIIGSIFSILTYKSFFKVKVSNVLKYVLIVVLPVVIYFVYLYCSTIYKSSVIAIIVCILIGTNLKPNNDYVFKFLNHKLVKHIGVLSYSLYIWQQLFTANQPWKNAFPYSNSIVFNLVALYIVAYLSYNYFEKPFLKLKTRFS